MPEGVTNNGANERDIDLRTVTAIPTPPLRNHAVTYGYHQIANDLADIYGDDVVNWCAVAVWASRSVGHALNRHELPPLLVKQLSTAPSMLRGPARLVASWLMVTGHRRSRVALIEGNRRVYDDIAVRSGDSERRIEELVASFERPLDRIDLDPFVEDLRNGFRLYERAARLPSGEARRELVFAANVLIDAYEQQLLQPVIEQVMFLKPNDGWAPRRLLRRFLGPRVATTITKVTALFLPDTLQSVTAPVVPKGGPFAGATFRTPEARAVVERFGSGANTSFGPAVRDWSSHAQRMVLIVDLFREHAADRGLFADPYPTMTPKGPACEVLREAIQNYVLVDRKHHESVATLLSSWSSAPTGVSLNERFSGESFKQLRERTDPPTDNAVAAFAAERTGETGYEPRSTLVHVFGLMQKPALTAQGREVTDLMSAPVILPSWANVDTIREGQEFFKDHTALIMMALFFASLPACYACADGAQVISLTNDLMQHTQRRLAETAQFIFDVMTPEPDPDRPGKVLEPFSTGSRSHRATQGVRMMHAAVRYFIYTDPAAVERYDKSGGLPINQEDLLGTLLSFGPVALEGMRRAGVSFSAAGAEAYCHVWNVVGVLLGVEPDLLPLTHEQGREVARRIRERNEKPSEYGKGLTTALLGEAHHATAKMIPTWMANAMRPFYRALLRHLVGRSTAATIGVRPARLFGSVVLVMSGCMRVSTRLARTNRLLRRMLAFPATSMLKHYLEESRSYGRPPFQFDALPKGRNR
jgi:hypothetical protein